MIAQREEKRYFTEEEYFEIEATTEERHEYLNGEIFTVGERHEYLDGEIVSMTGGTANHNRIAINLASRLNLDLQEQDYQVFIADLRLQIPAKNLYTYPDVMVVAGELEYAKDRKDTITNPQVIAEVLSPSTAGYDRGKKFAAYRTLSSFQEYLLIDPSQILVEHYSKIETNRWTYTIYEQRDRVLSLVMLPFEITVKDLYRKVTFDAPSEA